MARENSKIAKARSANEKSLSPLLTLSDEDFFEFVQIGRPVLGFDARKRPLPKNVTKKAIMEMMIQRLPEVVAKKIGRAPEGFELSQITLTGELAGKPFGIGVSGQVSVTYTKKKAAKSESKSLQVKRNDS